MELRDKIAALSSPELEEELGARPSVSVTPTEDTVRADALSALVNLGYEQRAAENAVAEARRKAGTANFEALLRAGLHALNAPKTSN